MAVETMSLPPASTPVRRVVVVLGMHRSGTSAVAGCIQRLGVDFGPRLMPATPDNPRGYYEHIDLVNLHDRLLLALGRSWDDTFPFPAEWWNGETATGRYRSEALGLLGRDFPTSALWGLKDPRLCRLLPWWLSLWQETNSMPLFVIVRRSPSEVAASLTRREGFSPAKSHLLWLQHVLEAERHTRGHERVLLDFKTFLADWCGALAPVASRVGLVLSGPKAGSETASMGFIDPALVRSGTAESSAARLPLWVEEVDAAMQQGIAGGEHAMREALDNIAAHLRTADLLFTPHEKDAVTDLRHQLEAVRRQASWYEAEWQKAHAKALAAHEKLAAKRVEIEDTKKLRQK